MHADCCPFVPMCNQGIPQWVLCCSSAVQRADPAHAASRAPHIHGCGSALPEQDHCSSLQICSLQVYMHCSCSVHCTARQSGKLAGSAHAIFMSWKCSKGHMPSLDAVLVAHSTACASRPAAAGSTSECLQTAALDCMPKVVAQALNDMHAPP